jgi:formamidopyrimidine-DNA glycosylase
MPELPDITIYIEALQARIVGQRLERARLASPFLLRTIAPPLDASPGRFVTSVRRIGKRIAIGLDDNLWLVLHLMIAGRLHWRAPGFKLGRRNTLAAFDFANGTLVLTEAGSKRRASLHVVEGAAGLVALHPGGLEILEADLEAFRERLVSANHTLKRALTDPRLFSGIGNAYSDEILHRARLSPVALTNRLSPEEIERLFEATRATLSEWIEKLRQETAGGFPENVTAFREGMAVHGRFGKPCPRCATKVQRIRYAENETNYCPRCQTGGRLLADRALSRLLKKDWPRTIEALETLTRR